MPGPTNTSPPTLTINPDGTWHGYVGTWESAEPTYDPLSLFSNNEDGMFYSPQHIESLFQDTAGTVPVTADGQLVARINDISGNGYHLTQSNAANQYKFREVGGVRWLDSEGRACLYDSTKKLTGGLTYGVALKLDTIAASFELFDSGSGSTSASNAIYLRHGNTDQSLAHVERGEGTSTSRVFINSVNRHVAYVARLPKTAGNTDHLMFASASIDPSTARLLSNETSGSGIRLGPHAAANLKLYAIFFVQRLITDSEREDVIGWLAEIGETETPYIWMGHTE